MRKLVLSVLIVIVCSCKSKSQNDFDTIIHYSITDEKAVRNENNNSFKELYSGLETPKSIDKDFEIKLISYGFTKKIVRDDKTSAICKTISNNINLKYHEVACIPMYRDILIFKKDNKTKAVLKVCFECGMNDLSGKFESNFNYQETDLMSNYETLYKIIYQ